MRIVRGKGTLLLKPQTTQQVSEILQYCNSRKLAVVPQGGNTGLVGGSVPVFDEIILSMSLMNKVEKIDSVSGVITAQAGCILEQLNQELAPHKLMMPLDLGQEKTNI
jgi:FAD/FMN-containing dehydrogenase